MHKNLLLVTIMAMALALAAFGARSVHGAGALTPAEIGVTADGSVHATPDTARVWIGVELFGPTLVPLDREADQRMAAIVAALRSAGISDQHMRTVGISIAPQYTTVDGQRQQLTGHLSGSMLEVETSDLAGLPALLDSAIAAGANRIDQVRFESQVLDQLRSQARDQAWQAARAQAEQLAQRAGTRLDRVTSVDEPMIEDTGTIQPDRATAYARPVGSSTSSVQSGELEVRCRLHVVWSTQQ
jgi:uncharacterized protein YggE